MKRESPKKSCRSFGSIDVLQGRGAPVATRLRAVPKASVDPARNRSQPDRASNNRHSEVRAEGMNART